MLGDVEMEGSAPLVPQHDQHEEDRAADRGHGKEIEGNQFRSESVRGPRTDGIIRTVLSVCQMGNVTTSKLPVRLRLYHRYGILQKLETFSAWNE